MFSIYLVGRLATDIRTFGIVIASAVVLVVPATVVVVVTFVAFVVVAAVAPIPGVSIVVYD